MNVKMKNNKKPAIPSDALLYNIVVYTPPKFNVSIQIYSVKIRKAIKATVIKAIRIIIAILKRLLNLCKNCKPPFKLNACLYKIILNYIITDYLIYFIMYSYNLKQQDTNFLCVKSVTFIKC